MADESNDNVDYSAKLKDMKLQMLEKIGNGGMNQNDILALMTVMKKTDSGGGFKDMMPLLLFSKMSGNNQQKPDQMMYLLFLEMMKGNNNNGGNKELNDKIDRLEAIVKQKEEEKKYDQVMNEIRTLRENNNSFGMKEILTLLTTRDQTIAEKDREVMNAKFEALINSVKGKTESEPSKFLDTFKAFKEISSELGMNQVAKKSNEEIISELVSNVATTFSPAINTYMETMKQPQYQPSMNPSQLARVEEIQNRREMPLQVPEKKFKEDDVYPELINISG